MPRRRLDRSRATATRKKEESSDSDAAKSSEEEFELKNDDKESSDELILPRRTPNQKISPRKSLSSGKKRKAIEHSDESSSEEYQDSDNDDDEEEEESDASIHHRRRSSQRKMLPSKSPSTQNKKNQKAIELLKDSSSEEEYQDNSNEEEESDSSADQRRGHKRKSPPSKSPSTRKKNKNTKDVLKDSSSDDEEEVATKKRTPNHKTVPRSTAVTPSQQNRRKQSPRTPPKSRTKMADSSDESSRVNPSPPRSRRKQRRLNDDDDDEEFVPSNDILSAEDDEEEEEEEEGEDVWTDENESDDDDDGSDRSDTSRVGKVGDIDEIGVANDSSDDEIPVRKPDGLGGIGVTEDSSDDEVAKKVPSSRSKQGSHGRRNARDDPSDSSSDDTEIKPAARFHKQKSVCSPGGGVCTSTHDAITLEELSWPHICFFPPEGERQCFALETLRQIALTAGHPKFRDDRVRETTQQTYLQPPHFRSAMSDELLDQIATRFSRDALDLHSSYHTRPLRPERPPNADGEDSDDDDDDYHYDMRTNNPVMWDMVQKYMGRTMGSTDLYVCPMCYRVAHKRDRSMKHQKLSPGKLSDEQLSAIYTNHFTIDPMRVLGSVDGGDLKLASMFCFRKLPQLKQHLKEEHGLDTTDVDGNDLYKKYKVRATDGLLQTFLNSGQRSYIKSMQSYWFDGNNQDFIYLLSLVRNAEKIRDMGGYDSDNPAVQTLMDSARDYFESFAGIVDRLWNLTVDPFRKYDENMDDFIDDVGSDEEVVDDDDRNMHRTLFRDQDDNSRDANLQFARALENRYRHELDEYDEEDESASGGGDLVDSDEEERTDVYGTEEEASYSESEDEFDKKMRLKRGKIGRRRVLSSAAKRRRASPHKKIITIHDTDSD